MKSRCIFIILVLIVLSGKSYGQDSLGSKKEKFNFGLTVSSIGSVAINGGTQNNSYYSTPAGKPGIPVLPMALVSINKFQIFAGPKWFIGASAGCKKNGFDVETRYFFNVAPNQYFAYLFARFDHTNVQYTESATVYPYGFPPPHFTSGTIISAERKNTNRLNGFYLGGGIVVKIFTRFSLFIQIGCGKQIEDDNYVDVDPQTQNKYGPYHSTRKNFAGFAGMGLTVMLKK